MIDHMGVNVSNFEESKQFYLAALNPLGYELIREFGADVTGFGSIAGFGVGGEDDFWIGVGEINTPRIHVAFRAESRERVNAFYDAAIKAGAKDNGAPGLRHYHPNYYGAFVLDPNGHNIEAVCHNPE